MTYSAMRPRVSFRSSISSLMRLHLLLQGGDLLCGLFVYSAIFSSANRRSFVAPVMATSSSGGPRRSPLRTASQVCDFLRIKCRRFDLLCEFVEFGVPSRDLVP